MSILAAFLLARTVMDTVDITRNVASTARTAAAAAEIASSVASIKKANSEKAAAEAQAAAFRSQQAMPQANNRNIVNSYDLDLFYAKVAMLSYIAKADNVISYEEQLELNQILSVAENMYGKQAVINAQNIFEHEGSSFMALEPYLQKIQDRDLDSFIFYADEFTKSDNKLTVEEQNAIQKLRTYIDSRKGKKNFFNLSCPNCGAGLRPDSYGYKADCAYCGYEVVLNTDNSPHKINTPGKCSSCGKVLAKFDNSKVFTFCPYCGGNVNGVNEQVNINQRINVSGVVYQVQNKANEPNLYITYNTNNPGVGMVTRIVSTGTKNTYINGQTLSFHLPQGPQSIVLKIGKKNYSRDIVIPANNAPVRIYGSFNGRAQISIDQPPC